jgi:dCTP diphosphatase
MSDILELTSLIDEFSDRRGWTQFHDQKNLVMALSVEVAELLEHFQWEEPAAFDSFSSDRREKIAMEAADVAIYLLRFCSVSNIDLPNSILKKLVKNAEKFELPPDD